MTLFDKPINDISEDDLQALVDNQTQEQKTLEFKGELPGGSDFAKKDFLADVSSFANTAGGCLVYGIKQTKGENGRIDLVGVEIADPDAQILQMTQIINSSIQPRIMGLTLRCIDLKNGRRVLVIRIPQSYVGPHMVTLQNSTRFCGRHSNGKYNLDVHELRQAFLLSATVGEKIRDFRLERVARLGADETPLLVEDGKAKLVVHILPFTSFSTNQPIDMINLGGRFHEFFRDVNHRRYNIDGAVLYNEHKDGMARKYYQVFRNGAVEFTEGHLTSSFDEKPTLASFNIESNILVACNSTFSYLKSFGIEPPVFIFVTLIGVKGLILATNRRCGGVNYFDRDVILIPEVQMDGYPDTENELATLMKPALDAMWNAGGMPRSESFDNQGRWKP